VRPFGIGGIFIAGMMYSYSFTIGFAALLFMPFSLSVSMSVSSYTHTFLAACSVLGVLYLHYHLQGR
jgi:hypothetical protein